MAQLFTIHPVDPQPRLIRQAVAIVKNGGVIAYPTDSSYALGCRIGDADAARRIRRIRGIDDDHPLTLVLPDLAAIGQFARLDNWQFRIVRLGTPGAYTFLLPATRDVPRRLQHPRRKTIGVRVPDHAVVRLLLSELAEPLLSSTLALADRAAPETDAAEIAEAIGDAIDLVIDAGPCPGEPTTVIDLSGAEPAVVREGAGPLARLGLARAETA